MDTGAQHAPRAGSRPAGARVWVRTEKRPRDGRTVAQSGEVAPLSPGGDQVFAACDRLLPYRLRSPPSDLRVPVVLTALRDLPVGEGSARRLRHPPAGCGRIGRFGWHGMTDASRRMAESR
jgi:hypothetical protein